MADVYLALAIHSHQPVGNFDHVFQRAWEQAYLPFLEEFEGRPFLKATLHYSGCLLEWIEEHHPEYLSRLRKLCGEGRVEMLGGGFYEPILTMIPDKDKIGQIEMMKVYLEKRLGQKARGAWIPERVWEQMLTSPLSQAHVEYVILDDFHFKNAGVMEDELTGYFLTEDNGNLLKVFASSEVLRYYIPFQDPEKTIAYLRSFATDGGEPLLVYGDDGEKFGIWPETYRHVYENGWLRRFFDALEASADWLQLVTLSEAVDDFPAVGKIYLPDASYREMTEWALPLRAQEAYEDAVKDLDAAALYQKARSFLRGGFWRNFKVKYPESNRMYGRMLRISEKLEQLNKRSNAYAQARQELYRGQCNCAYWHGVFGGLYLPHLRSAVYERLIRAEQIVDTARHRSKKWLEVSEFDLDNDGRDEVELANAHLVVCLKPDTGGHLVELHVRERGKNLLDTLSRRKEGYHANLAQISGGKSDDGVRSIHHIRASKQPHLERELHYDSHLREGLVDYVCSDDVSLEQAFRGVDAHCGEFISKPYDCAVRRDKTAATVHMCAANAEGISLKKAVTLKIDSTSLEIAYKIENSGQEHIETIFGVEFNFALLSAEMGGRYVHDGRGRKVTEIVNAGELSGLGAVGARDDDMGIDATMRFSSPADVWSFPIRTVSQSESGFELVYQSSVLLPRWEVRIPVGKAWSVAIILDIMCC